MVQNRADTESDTCYPDQSTKPRSAMPTVVSRGRNEVAERYGISLKRQSHYNPPRNPRSPSSTNHTSPATPVSPSFPPAEGGSLYFVWLCARCISSADALYPVCSTGAVKTSHLSAGNFSKVGSLYISKPLLRYDSFETYWFYNCSRTPNSPGNWKFQEELYNERTFPSHVLDMVGALPDTIDIENEDS
ncbi:hypothetical protein J6590_007333 [Homalodisca vitripennis]|nr:hypothetical protein J6590_007333 [Homalodisca vitripennis]